MRIVHIGSYLTGPLTAVRRSASIFDKPWAMVASTGGRNNCNVHGLRRYTDDVGILDQVVHVAVDGPGGGQHPKDVHDLTRRDVGLGY
ncbi:hypothetical protein PC116_g5111 [Phytophthora cactorum]|uniref:Uncharacterized protein n=1 Tax=Phytophthora cactorum TaxID=29920 RepID=A0A8T1CVM1_9STRA|nr:hypothetical protein PC114_g8636 [Phytophthora cactorum]KAG2927941.1 hypothetical protein PC115_g7367 [Phytophthora cactorum]KAG2987014.1 hypothetical protein PC118_g7512 [Phytophthora cactorum]KAG3025196.1 hypothetical protein PC119_g8233 [Phytophthora cactorum]KAG4247123.1 hypothetical protein PC116_g5111 [Phytophthora cactorum]